MKVLHTITWILIIIGGLNWLLFGLAGTDIGILLFGSMTATISKVIYVLVGLSAIYEVVVHKSNCKMCGSTSSSMPGMNR
jgi:uncharacterized membrane protein YuzA (DUF378 family)